MSQEPLTTEQQYLVSTSTSRLHDQYAHVAGRETIERLIRESLVHLSNSSVTKWLPVLAERFAADQLRALAKLDNLLDSDRPEDPLDVRGAMWRLRHAVREAVRAHPEDLDRRKAVADILTEAQERISKLDEE